jgi:hypothetical protein
MYELQTIAAESMSCRYGTFLSVSASRQILPSSALGSLDFSSSRLATDPVCAQVKEKISWKDGIFPPGNVALLWNVWLAVHAGSYTVYDVLDVYSCGQCRTNL